MWLVSSLFIAAALVCGQPLLAQTKVARPKVLGVAHVAYYVSDLSKARKFYEALLGFAEPFALKRDDGTDRIAFVKINDNQYLEPFAEPTASDGQLNHVAFYTDDAVRMRDYLAAQGESLPLMAWGSRRRQDLIKLLDQVDATVAELTSAIEQEAVKRPEVVRLMTHPGVGALTALAFVLIIGAPERFATSKQLSACIGLVPSEDSSGERRHLGHISKQGNTLLRFLLVAAAQITVRSDPDWRRRYLHLAMRRERAIAKIAMARRLAVCLYWMWRNGWDYAHLPKLGSHVGQPGNPLGRQ